MDLKICGECDPLGSSVSIVQTYLYVKPYPEVPPIKE